MVKAHRLLWLAAFTAGAVFSARAARAEDIDIDAGLYEFITNAADPETKDKNIREAQKTLREAMQRVRNQTANINDIRQAEADLRKLQIEAVIAKAVSTEMKNIQTSTLTWTPDLNTNPATATATAVLGRTGLQAKFTKDASGIRVVIEGTPVGSLKSDIDRYKPQIKEVDGALGVFNQSLSERALASLETNQDVSQSIKTHFIESNSIFANGVKDRMTDLDLSGNTGLVATAKEHIVDLKDEKARKDQLKAYELKLGLLGKLAKLKTDGKLVEGDFCDIALQLMKWDQLPRQAQSECEHKNPKRKAAEDAEKNKEDDARSAERDTQVARLRQEMTVAAQACFAAAQNQAMMNQNDQLVKMLQPLTDGLNKTLQNMVGNATSSVLFTDLHGRVSNEDASPEAIGNDPEFGGQKLKDEAARVVREHPMNMDELKDEQKNKN